MPLDSNVGHRNYSLAELHIHTNFSDGIAQVAEILDYVQSQTSLDVIAITDHDSLQGAKQALGLVANGGYRFQVVVGEEISTNAGHLIALFIEELIRYDETKSLADYVRAIHAQGGLCIVPHPMSRQKNSVCRADLERLLANSDRSVHPDALEILDPRVARVMNAENVEMLNKTYYHLAEVGNSDAHAVSVIATRYTVFPGNTREDLRLAIMRKATRPWSGVPPVSL